MKPRFVFARLIRQFFASFEKKAFIDDNGRPVDQEQGNIGLWGALALVFKALGVVFAVGSLVAFGVSLYLGNPPFKALIDLAMGLMFSKTFFDMEQVLLQVGAWLSLFFSRIRGVSVGEYCSGTPH